MSGLYISHVWDSGSLDANMGATSIGGFYYSDVSTKGPQPLF